MNVCYGSQNLDFESLLQVYPDREFENLTRSTIPLLSYWADPVIRLAHLCKALGVNDNGQGSFCFEYPVKSLGRNKASFTDAMYISTQVAIAIEAKSTEPQYDTVEKWLKRGNDVSHRREVARHWLEIIEKRTGSRIDDCVSDPLIYQMVHRLASLCSIDSSCHVLVYQIFEFEGHTADYVHALTELSRALDQGHRIKMYVHRVHMEKTDSFSEIMKCLEAAKVEDRPFIVRKALLDRSLFRVLDDRAFTSILDER